MGARCASAPRPATWGCQAVEALYIPTPACLRRQSTTDWSLINKGSAAAAIQQHAVHNQSPKHRCKRFDTHLSSSVRELCPPQSTHTRMSVTKTKPRRSAFRKRATVIGRRGASHCSAATNLSGENSMMRTYLHLSASCARPSPHTRACPQAPCHPAALMSSCTTPQGASASTTVTTRKCL